LRTNAVLRIAAKYISFELSTRVVAMPSPTPSQILAQIRSHYIARLRQAIADHATEGMMQMFPRRCASI
jgi:hypothetical protein